VLKTGVYTAGAIGYLALSVVDSSVRQVAIDGHLPTVASIQSGQYAFWGFEHMYTIGDGSAPLGGKALTQELRTGVLPFRLDPTAPEGGDLYAPGTGYGEMPSAMGLAPCLEHPGGGMARTLVRRVTRSWTCPPQPVPPELAAW
jgi:hypothetical protein